jgi:hypothetical protein
MRDLLQGDHRMRRAEVSGQAAPETRRFPGGMLTRYLPFPSRWYAVLQHRRNGVLGRLDLGFEMPLSPVLWHGMWCEAYSQDASPDDPLP